MSVCLPLCLSVCLSVCLAACLSAGLLFLLSYLSTSLPVFLFVFLSVIALPSVYLFLPLRWSICPCPPVGLSVVFLLSVYSHRLVISVKKGGRHHAVVGPQPHPAVRQVRPVREGQPGVVPPRAGVQHVPAVHVPLEAIAVPTGQGRFLTNTNDVMSKIVNIKI